MRVDAPVVGNTLSIRPVERMDRNAIYDILYHTGYMGDDLSGRSIFDDKALFGDMFCRDYLRYEPESCFVAVTNGEIIGYIIGTSDTARTRRIFMRHGYVRARLRLELSTGIKYPYTARTARAMLKSIRQSARAPHSELYARYPAHLHINVKSGHQRHGAGSRLLTIFEEHIRSLGVGGIHLETSDRNFMALPFYQRHGYRELERRRDSFWPDEPDAMTVMMAKEL